MLPSFPIAAVPIWFADSLASTFLRPNLVDYVRVLQPGTVGFPRAKRHAAVAGAAGDGDDDEHYNVVR